MDVRRVSLGIDVTDDLLASTLITAVEGGINYWAQVSNYKWDLQDPTVASVRVHEVEADHGQFELGHDVDLDDILRGINLMLQKDAKVSSTLKDTLLRAVFEDEAGDIDADIADCVMQFAVLGELVYG